MLSQTPRGTFSAKLKHMKITSPILKDLARQIASGNPMLGLALANEYLSPTTPLHRALVESFKRRLANDRVVSSRLATRLINGHRCAELPGNLRAQIGARVHFAKHHKMPHPISIHRRPLRAPHRSKTEQHRVVQETNSQNRQAMPRPCRSALRTRLTISRKLELVR